MNREENCHNQRLGIVVGKWIHQDRKCFPSFAVLQLRQSITLLSLSLLTVIRRLSLCMRWRIVTIKGEELWSVSEDTTGQKLFS